MPSMKTDSPKTEKYRAAIVAHIRRHGAVSRKQLGCGTRIRMPVITAITRDLVRNGTIVEAGRSGAGRGRKQVMLSLDGSHGAVMGIEFDLDHVFAVMADMCGTIVARRKAAMPLRKTKEAIQNAIIALGKSMLRKAGPPLKGIGIADPGVIDPDAGVSLLCSVMPEWRNVPLRASLESAFSVPVWLDENTRAKAFCEQRHGSGHGVRNMLYIDVGNGIGCGIVLEGRLFRGFSGIAGEVGHVRAVENGAICHCGSSGCLETVASYPAIIRQVEKALRDNTQSLIPALAGGRQGSIAMTQVFEAARQGDKLALGLLEGAAQHLGYAIANAVNLLNPESVVMNFNMSGVEDLMMPSIRRIMDRQVLRLPGKSADLRMARIGEEAGAWGAAMMMLDHLFEDKE